MQVKTSSPDQTGSLKYYFPIYLWAVMVLIIAELIGAVSIPLGAGKVTLLPMIWALVIAAIIGALSFKSAAPLLLTRQRQVMASRILQPALLVFIARLGVEVGGSLPEIAKSGWALAFQELGHFVGTVILAMPIALLLGIKREAIGATFSVGREPSLAIIGEKYGMGSPEGRGVLAEYITGTLFGALFISIVAGFIASLHIFDPRSLAMASGVGSASMMAAASGAINAQVDPETAKTVMKFAAASNLLTTTFGTYFTLFISLPLAVKSYQILEPILGRFRKKAATVQTTDNPRALQSVQETAGRLSWLDRIVSWCATGALTVAATWVSTGHVSTELVVGCMLMVVLAFIGEIISRLTRGKIPTVCWVSVIAMYASSPWCPLAAEVTAFGKAIGMSAILTTMLTFAGLSIAKDLPAFRKLGWRIVLVSFIANFGTFFGAALIAELFH